MEIIFVLLPISLILAFVALAAYFWNVKNGQYDDLDTPALRALLKDDEEYTESNDQKK